jgi:hypothetical protein
MAWPPNDHCVAVMTNKINYNLTKNYLTDYRVACLHLRADVYECSHVWHSLKQSIHPSVDSQHILCWIRLLDSGRALSTLGPLRRSAPPLNSSTCDQTPGQGSQFKLPSPFYLPRSVDVPSFNAAQLGDICRSPIILRVSNAHFHRMLF